MVGGAGRYLEMEKCVINPHLLPQQLVFSPLPTNQGRKYCALFPMQIDWGTRGHGPVLLPQPQDTYAHSLVSCAVVLQQEQAGQGQVGQERAREEPMRDDRLSKNSFGRSLEET